MRHCQSDRLCLQNVQGWEANLTKPAGADAGRVALKAETPHAIYLQQPLQPAEYQARLEYTSSGPGSRDLACYKCPALHVVPNSMTGTHQSIKAPLRCPVLAVTWSVRRFTLAFHLGYKESAAVQISQTSLSTFHTVGVSRLISRYAASLAMRFCRASPACVQS